MDRETRLRPVTVYRDVRCDRAGCGKALPVQEGLTDDTGLQYDNALVLQLEGGYGMFTDPEPWLPRDTYDPATTLVLCHECAHELMEDFFGRPEVRNWHTHAPDSGQHDDHHDDPHTAG